MFLEKQKKGWALISEKFVPEKCEGDAVKYRSRGGFLAKIRSNVQHLFVILPILLFVPCFWDMFNLLVPDTSKTPCGVFGNSGPEVDELR